MDTMQGLKRTHYCGDVEGIGNEVVVGGYVQKVRDLGNLIFIDLRDRTGIVQLAFDDSTDREIFEKASDCHSEYVLMAKGVVRERESKNTAIKTGNIEIDVKDLRVLAKAQTPPFEIVDDTNVNEELRLKYRYLDLRRKVLQDNLIMRSKIAKVARDYYYENGFIEIETPMMIKSTPEGARDYLVPSRVHHGKFYALPQSPQMYKQLLMIAGFDRYIQLARCFRDEDLRADRQPEFTQIDIEMSFVQEEDVWNMVESLMAKIFKEIKNVDLPKFIRLPYRECIRRFGSDKPDLRFGLELNDITSIFKETEFAIFKNIVENNGFINAIVVKNQADKFSRKDLDKLQDFVKIYNAKALSYLKVENDVISGSIAKVVSDKEKEDLTSTLNLENNDLVLIVADFDNVSNIALGALRNKLGHDLGLIDNDKFAFLWVTQFPMFEYSKEEDRYVAAHHPFTSVNKEDVDKLFTDPKNVYSRAYDLVLNGYELLSGSIRIHDQQMQSKVFEAIGMSMEEAQEKFGFFLEAFKYGTPPHGGVGIGLERLIMILVGTDNIRDVVAFPKTASASDLMSEAPNKVDEKQLVELGLKIKE